MNIPFTIEEFLRVFKVYNNAVWPMQIITYLMGIGILYIILRNVHYSGRITSAVLSFYWLWMGIVYHIIYFSSINKAAYIFGALFILQGILFLLAGVIKTNISVTIKSDIYSITGSIFVIYALVIYPVIGYFSGHVYPQSPCFAVAPCPVTIFTFGILLWADKALPKYILIIPLLWSLIGFNAALFLSIKEDYGLLIAGLVGAIMIIIKNRKK